METIPFDIIHSWWDGKVKVRKLKPFEDGRGLLGEIFRQDSDSFKNIVNTYVSETRPFIKRGPHEHNLQDDEFITWNSRMVYEFYNPETKEVNFFITEPKGIYSIYVEHNIHHGYRNLEVNDISYTLNSLSRLYKGFGRNDDADEIRHEKKTEHNKIMFIFGAGGKLGKALTEVAFENMGEHTFDIIPCFEKIKNEDEFKAFKHSLDYALTGKHLTFFNCAGLTNTKDSGPMNAEWTWTNINLPLLFAEMCAEREWEFVQISTNYVYHTVKPGFINYFVSRYTQSKKDMESIMLGSINQLKTKTTTLVRVANLFNNDPNDNNIFTRFKGIIERAGTIAVDPSEMVTPTHVKTLSKKLVDLFKADSFKVDGIKKVNILSMSFNLKDFVMQNFGITPDESTTKIDHGFKDFSSDPTAKIIHI
jgi:dTDP-4-dehydrorhamnose reductase/dTDP-4-dehydrorhamnose 3,5-epimerase-like enzyme